MVVHLHPSQEASQLESLEDVVSKEAKQDTQIAIETAIRDALLAGGDAHDVLVAIRDAIESIESRGDDTYGQDVDVTRLPHATQGAHSLVAVSATWAEVFPAEPDRIDLLFSNESAVPIEVGIGAQPPAGAEILIHPGQGGRQTKDARSIWMRCDDPHSVPYVESLR